MPKKQRLAKGRKPTNEHQKAKYKAHYLKVPANKRRRQLKHFKKHPNDLQLKQMLDKLI